MLKGLPGTQASQALYDVISERWRQIEEEGWSEQHDDRHQAGELARAAACYAAHSVVPLPSGTVPDGIWPFADEFWKPKTPREDLVRATALLIAEIERIDRSADRVKGVGQ